jgi:protein-disulfide isomerase
MLQRRVAVALCLVIAACARQGSESETPPPPSTPPAQFDLARVDKARQMGSETAPVWFIMGSDFQCPFCRNFHHDTWPKIEAEYVRTGKIRVAFMNHPMSFHPRAVPAAEAAMCAGAQDRFWAMHDSLFVNQDKWVNGGDPAPTFERFASSLGLDMTAWRNCVKTRATRALVEADYTRTENVGIKGTPGFVIGDSLAISGALPYADFKREIDRALARARR